jgi:hypothetical protein
MTLKFFERGHACDAIPSWVSYFIALGYRWPLCAPSRSLVFVSTPCESAAAGLITLGALIQRLHDPEGDELGTHKARLRSLAVGGQDKVLRHRTLAGSFRFGRVDVNGVWLKREKDSSFHLVTDANLTDWSFEGEPHVQALAGRGLQHGQLYRALSPDGLGPLSHNLCTTDSAIVLAGHVRGKAATRERLDEIAFQSGYGPVGVAELLSIHEWSSTSVSRVRYFNPRAQEDPFDRRGGPPLLVVADGPGAWNIVNGTDECLESDVIAVIPKTLDGDRLRDLGEKIRALLPWYEANAAPLTALPSPPGGVDLGILRRRGGEA